MFLQNEACDITMFSVCVCVCVCVTPVFAKTPKSRGEIQKYPLPNCATCRAPKSQFTVEGCSAFQVSLSLLCLLVPVPYSVTVVFVQTFKPYVLAEFDFSCQEVIF
jgi:hypothetical protein